MHASRLRCCARATRATRLVRRAPPPVVLAERNKDERILASTVFICVPRWQRKMGTSMALSTLTARERDTYRRYASLALPRHTSYPIAPAWRADYSPGDFRADLHRSAGQGRPLSVYVHIPYCECSSAWWPLYSTASCLG